jgi:membrane-bound lytic murein transglycosylase D
MSPGPVVLLAVLAAAPLARADGPAASPDQAQGGEDLYSSAKQLFDQYAPPEVKQQYDFPSREQFNQFLVKLQAALDGGSLGELAQYAPQAHQVLAVLRTMPDQADLADWLQSRLDEVDEAQAIASEAPSPAPAPVRVPGPAVVIPPVSVGEAPAPARVDIPYYDRWVEKLRDRPEPSRAAALMPVLRRAFSEEGVPPELAWLAEVESTMNPSARSPAGARGLFQLKAETARGLGLSTFLPDERTDPAKSAHAAARNLGALGRKFGSWPLAIAAYNAGEGRVGRILAARHADSFAAIASSLPAGTRMYVPKVCALVAVRTGVTPDRLPAPR